MSRARPNPAADPAAERASLPASEAAGASVDPAEVARFAALAESWWDPLGEFRPLHKLNPVRVAWLRDRIAERHGRDPEGLEPLAGLKLLDIGCGGGLLAEPMARLGAEVVGIDVSPRNIEIARAHAASAGLAVDYRVATAEALAATGARFDVVVSMEVVEHVADKGVFLDACRDLMAEDGIMALATISRTPQSFAFAILGAEYLLRWLPRGTHDWRKFLRPSELAALLRARGLRLADLKGVSYSLVTDRFSLGDDLSVNYMALAERA